MSTPLLSRLHNLGRHRFVEELVTGARRFWRQRRGTAAVFVAVATIPLLGLVGIATDTARGYMVKGKLSSAIDAAGLAGGAAFYLPAAERDADIKMFFNANFPSGYMGAKVTGPTILADAAKETLTLSASATVPTLFMRLFGHNNLQVEAGTEVTRATQALDLVLAVDISKSMSYSLGGSSRMAAAREAAKTLVGILFGSSSSKALLNMGVVPWSSKVNVTLDGVGYDSSKTTTKLVSTFTNPISKASQSQVYYANNSPVPLLSAPPSTWKGCVYSRYLHDGNTTNDADAQIGPVTMPGADWPAWQPVGPEGEPVWGWGICSLAVGWNECMPCPTHGITPLTNVKATVTAAIDKLTDPEGSTNLTQGLGWAAEVLLPGAPFEEAIANPTYKRQQAIVLLTDGQNFAASGDGYKTVFGYGSDGQTAMEARAVELANNLKAKGVIIYTIQFVESGEDLKAFLKKVASGTEAPYYFLAPDAATLSKSFKEVANHLAQLRLSK